VIGAAGHRSASATGSVWSRFTTPPAIDAAVAAFALVLASNVFNDEFLSSWTYGIAIRQILLSFIYVFVIVWLWRRYGYDWLLWSVRYLPLMFLVLGIALASTLWSLEPTLTFRRATSLIATSLVGIFLGYNFAPRALLRILFRVFAGLIVVSAFAATTFPDYTTSDMHRVGETFTSWRGVFANKNQLGSVAAVASVLFFIATVYGRVNRYFGIFLLLLSIVTLLMSNAATAYVVAFTGLFASSSFAIARRLRFPAIVTFLYLVFGLMCVAWIVIVALDDFTQLLARDATLTKRTGIWSDALQIVGYRPWTGYGYGAVWGKGDQTSFPSLATVSWATSAHNGFLTIGTELGLPTMVVAIVHLLVVLIASLYAYLRHRSPSTLFAVAYMFMALIANLPESFLFSRGLEWWMMFVAISTMVMRILVPTANQQGSVGARTRRRQHQRSSVNHRRGRRAASTRGSRPAEERP
jgi:O-antigen ligase